MLLGRRNECAVLDGLLEAVRAGRSGVLVVRGEAGVGKTTLLEYAIESASDLRVVRAVGVESEMEFAYGALHQLCAPLLDRLERLPRPQRDALATTFGLSVGAVPDRFLVGLAVLTLLSEVAAERPVLCVVDDAQWLDRASALALTFVARRLLAESLVLLISAREPGEELRGLPDLVVEGLRDSDARELLRSVIPGPLDERVAEQVVAETHGNPLALLELPRGLTQAQLAGGFGLLGALSLEGRIEQSFLQRLQALPEDSQQLLLVAAAETAGDPTLLWRAANRLSITGTASEPAESAGLLDVGARVRFRHPLVRSAIYRAATPEQRRVVHRALAGATDADVDPDRRAWHLAEATAGLDEEVAAELERAAERAQASGGLSAAAAFLDRAAVLTVEPSRRGERVLAAAQATHLAGAPDAALRLLAGAEHEALDELGKARANLLHAQIAFARQRDSDAPRMLLRAAEQLEPLDLILARETHLDVLSATVFLGGFSGRGRVPEMAQAALAAPRHEPQRPSDLLLDGLATRFTRGYAAAAPMLREAIGAYPTEGDATEETLRWMWLAGQAAVDLWDDQVWGLVATRYLELARQAGALAVLPFALNLRSGWHTFAGELATAASLADEAHTVGEATGSRFPPYAGLMLAAWQGKEAEAIALIEATRQEVVARGEAYALDFANWASAVLYNGLGRPEDARPAAERASEHLGNPVISSWGLVELIEAAVREGKAEQAADALERLSEITRAGGTDWALGVESRSRALLSEGEAAERLYREAIDRLSRTRVRVELGRAHLLFGEWLRRERRRLDAREQLRTAHEMFIGMGVEAFAGRAERELLATGERARKRVVETREDLTARELQVARLAGDGLSNPEIGARLFISPRTVEYHLHKVFSKLQIGSRTELQRALPGERLTALVS